ncbi:Phytanoyl-CoA dioxygenase [Lasallia pustulata]|uniref:Phytanoyl-CoA dioxygenase n=1 Tax=Lasallia pustulata TaxID=136370 RepID=A0A1W5D3N5_9LECA|nr:Phytanoyl-CoA dioxygenase [Lasallia pustulata]
MVDPVGHAPLLLTALLANQNNNAAAVRGSNNSATVGTVVVHEQIVEADYPHVAVHEQRVEADYPHAPAAASYDNNNKNNAILGTVEVYEQVTEANCLRGKSYGPDELGVVRLRGVIPPSTVLTQAQRESYHKDGYLVLPDTLSTNQVGEVLKEAQNLMKRIHQGGEGITRHDISRNGGNVPSPVGRILATFETGDKTASNPFERRIARLGCGVHKMPTLGALTHSAFNRSITASLGYSDPRITQSQLIAKLAGIGGQIIPHQDGCVSFTDPPSALTFWYALEDTTLENGCLCVALGSHLTEPLRQRLVTGKDGRPSFVDLAVPLWARGANAGVRQAEYEYQPLEVEKGTLVLFHGNLMHKSGVNKSEKNRMAYTFSVVEGSADCPDDSCMKPADGGYESL